ncbi:hypothetical protein T4D_11674 [Trichinella pseudospiralis]|uniref:Uncharacterized protein n=1 Tax=Trichinella pseudospiralis TaxID=6337 RepID=A0A0V1F7S2_TRIPS|nr:hypothetical protein T4D_11674 [Trichinella pseudospiralis]
MLLKCDTESASSVDICIVKQLGLKEEEYYRILHDACFSFLLNVTHIREVPVGG